MFSSAPSLKVQLQLGELSRNRKAGQDSADDSGSTDNEGNMIEAPQGSFVPAAVGQGPPVQQVGFHTEGDLFTGVAPDQLSMGPNTQWSMGPAACAVTGTPALVTSVDDQSRSSVVANEEAHDSGQLSLVQTFERSKFELFVFDADATDGVHGNAVVSPDIVGEMSQKAAGKDPLDQLVEKMGVGGTKTDNEDFFYDSDLFAQVQPNTQAMQATGVDNVPLETSPLNASLPAQRAGARPKPRRGADAKPSIELSLVQHFERSNREGLSWDPRAFPPTLSPKNEKLVSFLIDFMNSPTRSELSAGGNTTLEELKQELGQDFRDNLRESQLSPFMPEVIAFLKYLQSKMVGKLIGESCFVLGASCLIGNGVYYCHSSTNPTYQYKVLKAVYEAINGKKLRKQIATATL